MSTAQIVAGGLLIALVANAGVNKVKSVAFPPVAAIELTSVALGDGSLEFFYHVNDDDAQVALTVSVWNVETGLVKGCGASYVFDPETEGPGSHVQAYREEDVKACEAILITGNEYRVEVHATSPRLPESIVSTEPFVRD
jgi:hypothetical protein